MDKRAKGVLDRLRKSRIDQERLRVQSRVMEKEKNMNDITDTTEIGSGYSVIYKHKYVLERKFEIKSDIFIVTMRGFSYNGDVCFSTQEFTPDVFNDKVVDELIKIKMDYIINRKTDIYANPCKLRFPCDFNGDECDVLTSISIKYIDEHCSEWDVNLNLNYGF